MTDDVVSDIIEEALANVVKGNNFIAPTNETRIFKDECTYCFKTPFSKDGLFISLKVYHCFCKDHVTDYAARSDEHLFLQLESRKIVQEASPVIRTNGEPTSKMTKLAIEEDPKIDIEDHYHVVVLPQFENRLEVDDSLGDTLNNAIRIVSTATSAERLATLSSTSNAWDAEIKLITKHGNLAQLDNGKRLPNSGWKCETEGCNLEENLWLCLTDGSVRCGRSQFISESQKSAGNGHMKDYYNETKYPLVVKLGTICAQLDAADVYSYDEDDAVIDPNLDKHLAHFGLNPAKMEKTVKSTIEMELDMNEKWEWAKCQEDGAVLEPIFGPGYTGLINTGSSCYMNSVLQAVLQIDSFQERFVRKAWEIFTAVPVQQLHGDLNGQFAKVLLAMMSGDYSNSEDNTHNAIKPLQFKRVAAGNHPEFSTAKQQDVEEYIRFLFEKVSDTTPTHCRDPTNPVRFQMWNRFEDLASGKVRYTEQEDVLLHLPITQALLTPIEGSENEGRFRVGMQSALQSYFDSQHVEGYKSPITGEVKGATNQLRFKTFPDYLFVQVQKFAYTPEGQQKKLDVDFEVEEKLDLSVFRGNGQLESETSLPEDLPPPFVIPANVRAAAEQLQQMGFTENACIKAAYETKGNIETATEWLMNHLDDPTLNDEFRGPAQPSAAPAASANFAPESIAMILDLGFSEYQAKYALTQKTDVMEAIDYLCNNISNIPPESAEIAPPPAAEPSSAGALRTVKTFVDGNGTYELVGMISHMGSRPDSGHYVAHMLKEGKWVLFNDEKVALSQDPPKKLAYVYLYKRI